MSTRRDCTCPRARHQHGTRGAHKYDGCRCFPCRVAANRIEQRGKHGGGYADDGVKVPRIGTVRRIQALCAMGWSEGAIGRHLGASRQAVRELRARKADEILADTARRVAAVYNAMSSAEPTCKYRDRTARWARTRGWLPPIAWDDDTIDDPDAQPMIAPPLPVVLWIERNRMHIERVRTFDEIAVERYIAGTLKHRPQHPHTPELVEAVRRMREAGLSGSEIGRRVGLTGDAVVKLRERRLGDAA